MPVFLDTNILLYSISRDPHEADKRAIALDMLERDDCVLSVQVLQEFYTQATKSTRQHVISHALAVTFLKSWERFPIQDMTLAIFHSALTIKERYHFSYWDAAVIAAAMAQHCDTLFTEDLSHGQTIDGLRIINPFR